MLMSGKVLMFKKKKKREKMFNASSGTHLATNSHPKRLKVIMFSMLNNTFIDTVVAQWKTEKC